MLWFNTFEYVVSGRSRFKNQQKPAKTADSAHLVVFPDF